MEPVVYSDKDHEIVHEDIDPDALYVLSRLNEAGFTAYLVGGGVRDLLVQKKPKDFDISTSAKPEEVKRLFRKNCLLIGRRFRLAHIRFGRKIIEVSTFRAGDSNVDELIVRDNDWGTPEQDVLRRDFTINGLFYDPMARSVIDYVGGCPDIDEQMLRTIGEASVRFRQDPVRMLRLLKFRARFGFDMCKEAVQAMAANREEILKASPARLMEEIFRMLESGASEPFFRLMMDYKILELLLPGLAAFLDSEAGEEVYTMLKALDQRINEEKLHHPDRAILASCLVFPILEKEVYDRYLSVGQVPHIGQLLGLSSEVIEEFVGTSFCHFPRRIRATMHFILSTQYRILPPGPERPRRTRIARHREFPLALMFFRLRALAHPEFEGDYRWWKGLASPQSSTPKRRSGDRRRRRRRPRSHQNKPPREDT